VYRTVESSTEVFGLTCSSESSDDRTPKIRENLREFVGLAVAQQTSRFTTHPSRIGCDKPSASCISFICANGTHGAIIDVGRRRDYGGRRQGKVKATHLGQSKLQGRTIGSRVSNVIVPSSCCSRAEYLICSTRS
jgi:hypothetical protein